MAWRRLARPQAIIWTTAGGIADFCNSPREARHTENQTAINCVRVAITLILRQNGRHSVDKIYKFIVVHETLCIYSNFTEIRS